MDVVPSSSKGEYYGIVYHTRYKTKCRLEHLKLTLNNIYHLFRSDNLSFVIHLLLYHATMVIEFDCIVVICALLLCHFYGRTLSDASMLYFAAVF